MILCGQTVMRFDDTTVRVKIKLGPCGDRRLVSSEAGVSRRRMSVSRRVAVCPKLGAKRNSVTGSGGEISESHVLPIFTSSWTGGLCLVLVSTFPSSVLWRPRLSSAGKSSPRLSATTYFRRRRHSANTAVWMITFEAHQSGRVH